MTLEYELLTDTAQPPRRAHETDAGFDLHADEEVSLAPMARRLVRTGVAIALPAGTVGLVSPRSGLAGNSGITVLNAPGIVDSGFRGELRVILINLSDDYYRVRPGDRIAQLVVTPFLAPALVEGDVSNAETDRGHNGFGSTGTSG